LDFSHNSGGTVDQTIQSGSGIPLSDKTALSLIRMIKSGDKAAMATLYDRTSSLLFGLVYRILGDKAQAEETLLDIYTHIWKEAASHNPEFSVMEWLLMVARSRAIARLHWDKRMKRERKFSMEYANPVMTVSPEQQELVRASIKSLVPTQQEILEWTYCSGLSCGEIAAQIGRPVGAVRTHARLGLSKLSEMIRGRAD
jgi:RNA polymerase sigma-70 factor (ECF subfamily)